MRKTALFFFIKVLGQGFFSLSPLILSLLPACCSGSRAESPEERGGWVGSWGSRGRTERAAVSATIGTASGELANSGSGAGTELRSRHLRADPTPTLAQSWSIPSPTCLRWKRTLRNNTCGPVGLCARPSGSLHAK